uniref:Cation/H+ exchanger domain-containing protein n=1 Tax=Zooxanthella nutricula TaxID=1333877 RepID=A0A7S2I203_9DINO
MTAAGFPWIFCAIYFMVALGDGHNLPWQEALIAARFAAPTSAGILFTMLEAAGMSKTWIFQKARILAIFDDLDTLLLMVPLKALFVGPKWELSIDLVFVTMLIIIMYVYMHRLDIPCTWPWVMLYSASVAIFCELVHFLSSSELTDPSNVADTLHLEVLLPAFTFGCVIKIDHGECESHPAVIEGQGSLSQLPVPRKSIAERISADTVKASLSAVFMILVGFSMPPLFTDKHDLAGAHRRLGSASSAPAMPVEAFVQHIVVCTILMNVGKLFPACCYRKEVNLRTRIALAVAMMPRGEVCAGIIVNALALGIQGPAMTVAVFCLATNMMMVSGFIFIVKKLTWDAPNLCDPNEEEETAVAAGLQDQDKVADAPTAKLEGAFPIPIEAECPKDTGFGSNEISI